MPWLEGMPPLITMLPESPRTERLALAACLPVDQQARPSLVGYGCGGSTVVPSWPCGDAVRRPAAAASNNGAKRNESSVA